MGVDGGWAGTYARKVQREWRAPSPRPASRKHLRRAVGNPAGCARPLGATPTDAAVGTLRSHRPGCVGKQACFGFTSRAMATSLTAARNSGW